MSHPGGQTPGLTLPLESHPCDDRPLEFVECVTLERHSTSTRRQDDDHRLALHGQMVAPMGVTDITILLHVGVDLCAPTQWVSGARPLPQTRERGPSLRDDRLKLRIGALPRLGDEPVVLDGRGAIAQAARGDRGTGRTLPQPQNRAQQPRAGGTALRAAAPRPDTTSRGTPGKDSALTSCLLEPGPARRVQAQAPDAR